MRTLNFLTIIALSLSMLSVTTAQTARNTAPSGSRGSQPISRSSRSSGSLAKSTSSYDRRAGVEGPSQSIPVSSNLPSTTRSYASTGFIPEKPRSSSSTSIDNGGMASLDPIITTTNKEGSTVVSRGGTLYTVPPNVCETTFSNSKTPAVTYRNTDRTCGMDRGPTQSAEAHLEPIFAAIGSLPPKHDPVVPCSAWFFIFCINFGSLPQIQGFGIGLPPGIRPPGPPPRITFPPILSIKVNTIGTLPPWPSISIDPKGVPTFDPKPSDCVTTSGAICMTSTSYGVSIAGGVTKTTGSSVISTCNTIYGCQAKPSNGQTTVTSVTSSIAMEQPHSTSQSSFKPDSAAITSASRPPSMSSVVSSCGSTTVTDCSTACSAVSTTGSLSTSCYSTTCSVRIGCSATASSVASTSTIGCPPLEPREAPPDYIPILGYGKLGGYIAVMGWTSPTASITYTNTDDIDEPSSTVVSSTSSSAVPVTTSSIVSSSKVTSGSSTTARPSPSISTPPGSSCAVATTVSNCVVGLPCPPIESTCLSWVATGKTSTTSARPPPSLTISTPPGSSCAVATRVDNCEVGPPCPPARSTCISWVATGKTTKTTTTNPPPTTTERVLQTSPVVCNNEKDYPGHKVVSKRSLSNMATVFCLRYPVRNFGPNTTKINVVMSDNGINARFVIEYLGGCKATSSEQDSLWPQNNLSGITCADIMLANYEQCLDKNGGVGGVTDIGCLRYTVIAGGGP